jgi:N6-L-threonylcarbamoyladenine synthase
MIVLGIESSCDECAAALVEDGRYILSNVVATQIPFHAAYNGVVPEIASRKHTEWIYGVVKNALDKAGIAPEGVGGVAVTSRPGLLGSLLVGLSFAKAFAWARNLPFIAVDHMLAHLYAPRLTGDSSGACGEGDLPSGYPFLGLLVSGGHSIICRVDGFDDITVLGATIDDAVGEAFDKVSKHYGFGYPGGAAIDKLAQTGDPEAFRFPLPKLHKENRRDGSAHPYDLSYSGLKTAVINQLEQFRVKKGGDFSPADIAASFQKTAVEILLRAL